MTHPILADYGTDQSSMRINDKSNYIVVKLLTFFFKIVSLFQSKFKTPIKNTHQSLSLHDTDFTSDDEEHIYSRIPKPDSTFSHDKTLHAETFSTMNKPKPFTIPESTSAIEKQTNSQPSTHCSQIIPFDDTSLFKYKHYFQCFFLPNDSSVDLKALHQQQSQVHVLRTVFSWLTQNENSEFLTLLVTGTLFLHA